MKMKQFTFISKNELGAGRVCGASRGARARDDADAATRSNRHALPASSSGRGSKRVLMLLVLVVCALSPARALGQGEDEHTVHGAEWQAKLTVLLSLSPAVVSALACQLELSTDIKSLISKAYSEYVIEETQVNMRTENAVRGPRNEELKLHSEWFQAHQKKMLENPTAPRDFYDPMGLQKEVHSRGLDTLILRALRDGARESLVCALSFIVKVRKHVPESQGGRVDQIVRQHIWLDALQNIPPRLIDPAASIRMEGCVAEFSRRTALVARVFQPTQCGGANGDVAPKSSAADTALNAYRSALDEFIKYRIELYSDTSAPRTQSGIGNSAARETFRLESKRQAELLVDCSLGFVDSVASAIAEGANAATAAEWTDFALTRLAPALGQRWWGESGVGAFVDSHSNLSADTAQELRKMAEEFAAKQRDCRDNAIRDVLRTYSAFGFFDMSSAGARQALAGIVVDLRVGDDRQEQFIRAVSERLGSLSSDFEELVRKRQDSEISKLGFGLSEQMEHLLKGPPDPSQDEVTD